MERRKFLANLVCLGVGASLVPKVIGEMKAPEPSVDPRVFEYPLTEKECYKPPDNLVPGCITSLSSNEIIVYPYNKLEEFPALKKGDKAILFSSSFSETTKDSPLYAHKEENFEHYIIVLQEDVPCAGKGNPITFMLNGRSLFYIKMYDSLLFKTK